MKNIRQTLLFLISALVLASCNNILQDVDVPPSEPQLVIQSHINPADSLVTVSVSFSKPIFNKPASPYPDFITNADIEVRCGQNTIPLVFNADNNIYEGLAAPLQLAAEKSVKVSVRAPGYYNADGNTIIPKRVNKSLQVISITDFTENGYLLKRAKVKFRDWAGEDNYYRIFAIEEENGQFRQYAWISIGKEYISDAGKDGEEIITTFDFNDGARLKVFLFTTDKSYYMYHNAVANYTDDNPFADPSMIPTNINNGLGMITSYLSYSMYAN
jgi:hypothetical protein